MKILMWFGWGCNFVKIHIQLRKESTMVAGRYGQHLVWCVALPAMPYLHRYFTDVI